MNFYRRGFLGHLFLKIVIYSIFFSLLLLFMQEVRSSSLEITVVSEKYNSNNSPCSVTEPAPCISSIHDAFSLIENSEWRLAVARKFDVVRLVFSDNLFRLSTPINLRWGGESVKGTRLELVGNGIQGSEQQTVFSGARELASPTHFLTARHLLYIDLSHWEDFEPPPARGPHLPIRPVMAELYRGDVAFPVAGWPNNGYGRLKRLEGSSETDRSVFSVVGRNSSDWKNEKDLHVLAYWFHDWSAETYPVSILPDGNMIIGGKGSHYGIKDGQRLRVENVLSELDSPGEWYLDRGAKRLFIFLEESSASRIGINYELSLASGLLKIDDSQDVLIRNIVFEKSRGDAVTVTNSQNIVLDKVSIRHTGNRAFVVEGGSYCGIRNSLIEHNGEGAVTLSGGDRKILQPSNHFVENSTIRNFSRLAKSYRFAAELKGVGQRVSGNVISEGPHTAIYFSGNDHKISNNDIFDVVKETGDAGAIYTGRDFTAQGTVIERNFIHDIKPDDPRREVKGVYLDDEASGIVVRDNIFSNVQQPVFIGGGRDNLIDKNIFYNSSPAIHLDDRGLNWARAATLDKNGEIQANLDAVPYQLPPYSERYPNLAKIREDDIGAPKYNRSLRNIFVKSIPYRVFKNAISGIEISDFSESGEDVFLDPLPENGRKFRQDFRVPRQLERHEE